MLKVEGVANIRAWWKITAPALNHLWINWSKTIIILSSLWHYSTLTAKIIKVIFSAIKNQQKLNVSKGNLTRRFRISDEFTQAVGPRRIYHVFNDKSTYILLEVSYVWTSYFIMLDCLKTERGTIMASWLLVLLYFGPCLFVASLVVSKAEWFQTLSILRTQYVIIDWIGTQGLYELSSA